MNSVPYKVTYGSRTVRTQDEDKQRERETTSSGFVPFTGSGYPTGLRRREYYDSAQDERQSRCGTVGSRERSWSTSSCSSVSSYRSDYSSVSRTSRTSSVTSARALAERASYRWDQEASRRSYEQQSRRSYARSTAESKSSSKPAGNDSDKKSVCSTSTYDDCASDVSRWQSNPEVTITYDEPHYRSASEPGWDIQDLLTSVISPVGSGKQMYPTRPMPNVLKDILERNSRKDFHCPICNENQINEHILRRHLRKHEKEKREPLDVPKMSLREKMKRLFGGMEGGGRPKHKTPRSTTPRSQESSARRITRGISAAVRKEMKKRGKGKLFQLMKITDFFKPSSKDDINQESCLDATPKRPAKTRNWW